MELPKKIFSILLQPRVFFLIPAFILVQLWFSKDLLFGGTEVGVPTYTPEKILNQIKWTWWEALGPGASIPTASAAIPLYALMAFLEYLGFSAILIQKTLFFILIYLQGLGVSLVFKAIFLKKNKLSILAGLFYIFNAYMMTYIWHRFIYTNFILSASFPLFIYFYLQLIEKEKIRYIFLFIFTSLVSSYMYSAIAPVMAVWFSIFSLYLTALIINRTNIKKMYRITILSLILLTFWITSNLWWIYPLSQNIGIFNAFSLQSNVQVLVTLSEKSSISNIIRGVNFYNVFIEEDWGKIYKNFIFQIISWVPFALFIFGIKNSIKSAKSYFMIILFIIGVLLAKGSAGPLGFVNSWAYSHIFILGAIKNPFEKLGLIVFLPISVLGTVGVNYLWNLYKKPYYRILVSILIISCGIYVWPMWSSKIFGSAKYPPFFQLPNDYEESSVFLSKELEKDEGKILHLPIAEGDSTTYLWPNLYNGVDLTHHIFPGISISRFSYTPFVDVMIKDMARIFHTDDYQLYDQVIQNFGIKYIVLNKDVDWYFRNVDNPVFIENKLDKFSNLSVIKETNHLKIYKYTSKLKDRFSTPTDITTHTVTGKGRSDDSDFMWEGENIEERAYLQITEDKENPSIVHQSILLPKRIIIERAEFKNNDQFIPPTYYEKYLPDSVFFPFISIFEKIETYLTSSYSKPVRVLLLSTKRLREAQRFREQDKEDLFNYSIQNYSAYVNEALRLFYYLKDEKVNDERLYLSKYILRQEKSDLENLLAYSKDDQIKTLIKSDLEKINEFNKSKGFALIYPVGGIDIFKTNDSYTYQFSLSDEFFGNSIIVGSNSDYFETFDNRSLSIYVDGIKRETIVKKVNSLNWFDLGEIMLDKGDHEITIPISNDNNMISSISQFKNTKGLVEIIDNNNLRINSLEEDDGWVDYELANYNSEEKYVVKFYYKVIKGTNPFVEIIQEKDEFNSPYKDKKVKTKDVSLPDSYDFGWRYFETSFGHEEDVTMKTARSTIKPVVRIGVPVWNNCESNNLKNPELCKNEQIKRRYNKGSVVEFRDLKVAKLINTQFLLRNSQMENSRVNPHLKYKKISPSEYQIEIEAEDPNFILVFNETYHPGWKVEVRAGNQIQTINEINHYLTNGYANGWLINQSGKINLKILFTPQDSLKIGVIVSIIGSLIITSLIVGRKFIKGRTKG